MSIDSTEAAFLAITFLVPGFVCSAVLSMLVPRRTRATDLRMLEFLTLSCINYAVWSWAILLVFAFDAVRQHPVWMSALLVVIIFISPAAMGVFFGNATQRNWVSRFLARLGFRTIHPAPSAWDYQFGRQKPYWVTVTMKNGSRVHGLFGTDSFAGEASEQRDLYFEAVFRVEKTGDWSPVEDSGGVLVMADEIAAIEFRKLAEVKYGE